MRRLVAALRCDAVLQLRHGFLLVGILVAVFWVLVLSQLPRAAVEAGIAPFLFLNLLVTTFYFVAGWVLFEKEEGTLEALVVTPLREREYLLSKIGVLALLGGIEGLGIAAFTYGTDFAWPLALLGIATSASLYTCLGFVLVSRYDSINEFLLPSSLFTLVAQLPVIDVIGLWESPVFLLWPTYASLLLLEAAFHALPPWKLAYALVYAVAATWLFFRLARVSYQRFIVRHERGAGA